MWFWRTYTNLGWQMAHITGRDTPENVDYQQAAATITRLVLGGVMPEVVVAPKVLKFAT
ncbi:TetR family transcriptional regulator C-terminal domain-containing protein [Pseudomonas fluorescens]|uniref:TetR family transcriptional regulator C-terminal domain-containing protein n=1 Tax=Pseudomonas fluorescens TaxID=294 RepID=UPI001CD5FF6B|nr:TetR family transcriptional regulator C-terminal domain-containing protein [Pseudomonas fluorescens]